MEFIPIKDYEKYSINREGVVMREWKNGTKTEIKGSIGRNGYRMVSLTKQGKTKHFTVHRLLAIYFIPNPDNKPICDHINRDRSDNRIENLRWVTTHENCMNKTRTKYITSGTETIDKYTYTYHRVWWWEKIDEFEFKRRSKRFTDLEKAQAFLSITKTSS